jgi:ABC-type spermidine/putrescine transport system permease subunit II
MADSKEDWMQKKWRPAMGWMYMIVCMFDMVVFPILWSLLQSLNHGQVTSQWQPLTLQGAGLFHIAMGAVLGIAAFGRTQEKIAGASTVPSSEEQK